MDSNNRNILIVLAGGFIVAILVALMVQAALKSGDKEEVVAAASQEILVAAKSLSVGHELQDGDLKWQAWPEDGLFPGAIIRDGEQTPLEAINGQTTRSLSEGQPIHMNVVVEEETASFLSAKVAKGMRAVGISVKSYTLADRLIRPGDFVDVILTYRVRVNTRNNPEAQSVVNRFATETIIENVRVLAVDKDSQTAVDANEEEDGKKKKSSSSKSATLTLEVTSLQAEELMLALEMGDIGIALRSLGDQVADGHDKTTTDVGMTSVLTKLSEMQRTSPDVRIYEGSNVRDFTPRNANPTTGVSFDVESEQPNQIILEPTSLGGPARDE
ncbi:MAG: Flp pilus assembly protein CpaB [Pseudomonadota bacterium]